MLREESTARVRDLIEEARQAAPTTARSRARRSGRSATSTRASWTPSGSRSWGSRRCRPLLVGGRGASTDVECARRGARPSRSATASTGPLAALVSARPALAGGLRRLPRAGGPRSARRVLLPRGEVRRDPRRPTSRTSAGCSASPASPRRRPRPRASWRSRRCLAAAHWDNGGEPRRDQDLQRAHARRGQGAGAPVPLGRLAVRPAGAGGLVRQGRRPRSRASSAALGAALESTSTSPTGARG